MDEREDFPHMTLKVRLPGFRFELFVGLVTPALVRFIRRVLGIAPNAHLTGIPAQIADAVPNATNPSPEAH